MYGKHLWRVGKEYHQSKLIGSASFFSQWYFASSGHSRNENLSETVASFFSVRPSSLTCFLMARYTRHKGRALWQAIDLHNKTGPLFLDFNDNLQRHGNSRRCQNISKENGKLGPLLQVPPLPFGCSPCMLIMTKQAT